MSAKPFEDFIVSHFLSAPKERIKAGFKYQFRSPDTENSRKIYASFVAKTEILEFLTVNNIKLVSVKCHGIKVIPVIHKDTDGIGYTENFISYLRDEVSSQKGIFKDTALLILHNSMLDTIINSSEDLASSGGIFDPREIKKSLTKLIDTNDAVEGQQVSKILLDYQYDLIIDEKGSMFGFEALHNAMVDGDIRFHEINLLNDPAILKMDSNPEQIRKRLDQNKDLYDEISNVVQHYPDQLVDWLPKFSEQFIRKHFNIDDDINSWKKSLSLDEVLKESEKNSIQNLELRDESSASGELLVRTKSETKSAQKERHILIIVDNGRVDFDLKLDFVGAKISKDEIKLFDKEKILSGSGFDLTSTSKESSLLLQGGISDVPVYFMVSFNRTKPSERFKFKCLVVKRGWFNTDGIATSYLINPNKKIVTLQTQDCEVRIGLDNDSKSVTEMASTGACFDVNQHSTLNFESLANEVDTIDFSISNGNAVLNFEVEGAAASENLVLPLIFDLERGRRLFTDHFNGTFNRTKQRAYIENKELDVSNTRLDFLNYEASWIDEGVLGMDFSSSLTLQEIESIAPEIASTYRELFEYLRKNNTLPSLSGWGPVYRGLIRNLIDAFYTNLNSIEINQYLDENQKKILKIGFHRNSNGEWITSLHPLVLSYYLELSEKACKEDPFSYLTLPGVTLERLNAQGLLPYLYDGEHEFCYVKAEPDNPFWLRCVPQQSTNYSYVTKLVKDKVREFTEVFKPLFEFKNVDVKPTIIINSVNNYENKELFMGLVEHLIRNRHQSVNIHVNIYDEDFSITEFDRFSEMASYELIKRSYGLNASKTRDFADSIVDLMRTHITYSKFVHKQVESQKYAHLTFFRNNQKVAVIDVNPAEKLSGICAHGLITGEASSNEKGNYITGFGTANFDHNGSTCTRLALVYGRLVKPSRKSTFEYRDNSAIALAVNDKFKAQLERSYASSIWTTIIDPKVTLDFFESTKDMLLIHYSDQYTSSAGYDAITVTRQTQLYDKVLEKDEGGLVTEFNAFNGEWLLKLITDSVKGHKEKKGILSAYKLISILLSKSDIVWVPISAAELVRVSGNIGLSLSESEFSRFVNGFKSGPISDDVLFVGFKDETVFLLPLEVKTGFGYDATKAIQQAKELGRYLTDILNNANLASALYRSLFVRQAILQIEKYQLYKIYPDGYFSPFLNKKEWWLQGDYTLAKLDKYPEGFVVANLESDKCLSTSTQLIDGILKIEVPSSFLKATISTPLQSLWNNYGSTAVASIPDTYFLGCTTDYQEIEQSSVVESVQEVSVSATPNLVMQNSEATINSNSDEHLSTFAQVSEGSLKVLVGHDVNHDEPVYWEPTNTAKFMNTNSGIIGTMGTGKTQCTKSVVTQLYRNQHLNVDGKSIGMLIFDYKSDYVDDKFLVATNAKKYNLHKLPYNPLSLFGHTPMLPVHTARGFSETMAKAFGLGQKQQLRLRKLIGDAYDLAGISKSDSNTWARPAPTIADVWALFIDQEKVEEDSLYAALETLADLEVFETDVSKCTSLYHLVDGIRVVELAGYPTQVQSLVVALTLDLFYSQMQKQGKPQVRGDFRQITKMILVDEADNFMSQDFPSLRKILKEGREYGVGVILSTQDITHFKTKENDYSAYILSWLVHRVSQISNQDIKSLFNKDGKSEQEYLMKSIRELEKHCSLYVNGDKEIKKIKDLAFWEL